MCITVSVRFTSGNGGSSDMTGSPGKPEIGLLAFCPGPFADVVCLSNKFNLMV